MMICKLPTQLVVIDAKNKTYSWYLGKKRHFTCNALDRLLDSEEVEILRTAPALLVDFHNGPDEAA